MKRIFGAVVTCLSLVLSVSVSLTILGSEPAAAQQASALITGTIKDTTGAVVAGAKVTVTNTGTNASHSTISSKDGDYLFTLLPIGTYQLAVEAAGFEKYAQTGITLEINQKARLDVELKVGSTSQVVEVQGNVTQVDTVSATLGKVENNTRIENLPLAARDTMQLGLLQAGVFAPDQDDGSGNPFSVSGQRSESMTFLIDGADNNDFLGNNMIVDPNPDAVDEFKIITNNYEAEYGRTSGGIVNQVVKSGTNAVHGDVFDYFRNTALDASDYFLQQAPIFRYNLFGGTIGFPIVKDKMFLFASYQGARRAEGQNPGVLTVLSPAERNGDFSALLPGTPLYNPATGNYFPNNQVPVDPVIKNYINKFLPLPNAPNNGFVEDPVASLSEDQFVFRYDWNISHKDSLSAFYILDDQPQTFPFEILNGASTGGNVPIGSGFTNSQRFQAGSLSWTRTISPTMLNELRFSVNRSATYDAVPLDTTSPSALGFTTVTPDDPKGTAPPILYAGPSITLGPSPQGPTKIHDMTYQYQDTFSWTRGAHALKFGGDIRFVQNNFDYDFYNNGSFDFGNYGGETGYPFADFVGGFWDNYFQFSNASYGIRTHQLYFFAQDAWKVTRNLSLDYGIRYEYDSPQEDPHNEIMGWFPGQQSKVYPGAPPNFLYPGDPGTPNRGLLYPDYNNFAPRFGFSWNMLGNGKLVMRGGAGIFYDIEDGALNLQFGGQPPFGYAANNYPCYTTAGQGSPQNPCIEPINGSFVTDPFQTANTGYANPYPFIASGNLGKFFTPKIPFAFVVTPHFRTPYAENLNYGFQYQATKDTMIEAVYVGSFSKKAISGQNYNVPTLGGPQGLMAQYNYDVSQGIDPYFGIDPDCSRPLAACNGGPPAFTGTPTGATQILTNLSAGSSSSNELQMTVDRRMNHGLGFRVAYTVAKTIDTTSGFRARSSTFTDPADPRFDRGLADFDTPQRLVLSPIWQIPYGQNASGFKKYALGGWTVSTIAAFQKGNPFTIFSNNYSSDSNIFLERPDQIGPIQTLNPRKQSTFAPAANGLNGSCLSGPTTGRFLVNPTNLVCAVGPPNGLPVPAIPGGTYLVQGGVPLFTNGNMGRNVLRGPGINNWDISLMKNFQFTESKYLQFQTNFFNAFNHAQFFSPTLSEGAIGFTPSFGQVTTDATGSQSPYYRGPRIIQFALKVYF
jgi:Carboxypeptidase regulatory-like domain